METSHLRHTLCIVVHDRIPAFSLLVYVHARSVTALHTHACTGYSTPRVYIYIYMYVCMYVCTCTCRAPAATARQHVKFARAMRLRVLVTCNPLREERRERGVRGERIEEERGRRGRKKERKRGATSNMASVGVGRRITPRSKLMGRKEGRKYVGCSAQMCVSMRAISRGTARCNAAQRTIREREKGENEEAIGSSGIRIHVCMHRYIHIYIRGYT